MCPMEHWFSLRRLAKVAALGTLLSWSGTMFEYLMPVLFTRTFGIPCSIKPAGTRCRGKSNMTGKRIPWGISESAYSAMDSHQIYQYRAFGVPALALNPVLEEAPVVAPYASCWRS